MCEDDPLGLSRRARGGDDEGVAGLDGLSIGQGMLLAVGSDDPCRPQRVEHGAPRHAGQPGVEWRRGVARVPDGAQCVDESHATWEVECDELWHWPVA